MRPIMHDATKWVLTPFIGVLPGRIDLCGSEFISFCLSLCAPTPKTGYLGHLDIWQENMKGKICKKKNPTILIFLNSLIILKIILFNLNKFNFYKI